MLKFSDLKVDFKSFENILSSYMKLFPGSYMPLLIMYLSREGLLEVKSDIDSDDSNTLLSISNDELCNFVGISFPEYSDVDTKMIFLKKKLGIDLTNSNWWKTIDLTSFGAFGNICAQCEQAANFYSIKYYNNGNEEIDRIVNIIRKNSQHSNEKAALWLFYNVFMAKAPVREENESNWYFQDAAKYFELTLNSLLSYSGQKECFQPFELTRIILSQYRGGSVYNPFAGIASYHVAMSYGLDGDNFNHNDELYSGLNSLGDSYYGEEINELTWAIGKLRLLFYQMDSSNYIIGDSTKEFEGSINNILCTPPFNYKVVNESGNMEYADHFVLRRGLKMLADNGMMAVVVPVSFLTRKDTFDIRKELITSHKLTHVVLLPENTFSHTKVNTAILFVHNNAERNKLKFVDATSRRVNIYGLNVPLIANLIEHDSYPTDEDTFTFGEFGHCDWLTPTVFNACVSFEEYSNVVNLDYDLSPSNYFPSYIDIPDGFKLVRFEELTIAKSPANISGKVEGKVLSSSSLVKDYQMPYIDIDSLESKVVNSNYMLLERKSLLVSSMNELKPSIFVPSDVNVYVSPNILAFYLNDKKINAEYLVGELSQDYVKEQLRLRVLGSTIHRIKRDDILSLKILVPDINNPLKKEKEIANERKNDFLKKMGVELAELKDKRHDEYVKMLRQRKHRIQQVMNEFAPAFSLLNKCRETHGGVLQDTDIVATRTGETVDSYFQKLQAIINKVEDLVTNLVDKEQWGNLSMVNIDCYVDDIPQHHLSDKYDIQTLHDHDVYVEEDGETADLNNDRFININIDDITILFDNIIANASKWGFTDSIRRDYRIRINVSDTAIDGKSAVRICISNNGEPIHPSVDRKRFFEWGYGSGTGIGTWQLKDIVEHYGGTIKLNEYPDEISGFQTEYEIIIPLANND